MNKSLLARTKPEFYTDYVSRLRAMNILYETIDELIAEEMRVAQSLLGGKCPKCGAPSARYVNRELQQGDSEMPGAWVMYRCSTQPPPGTPRPPGCCDFMCDLKEGEESN